LERLVFGFITENPMPTPLEEASETYKVLKFEIFAMYRKVGNVLKIGGKWCWFYLIISLWFWLRVE